MILLVMLTLTACKRSNQTVVYGELTEHYTGIPLDGTEVELAYTELGNGTYSSGYTSLGTVTTDAEGQYRFEFDNVSAIDYRVRAIKDGYFLRELKVGRDDWRPNQENEFNITLYETSSITFRFYNQFSSGNTLIFNLKPHSAGCSSCCSPEKISIGGINDTTFACNVYGNQSIGYEYLVVNSQGIVEEGEGVIEVDSKAVRFEQKYE